MADRGTVTRLLSQWADGDRDALDALMPLVQAELRKTAAAYLGRERAQDTVFQPTALVHEAYLHLVDVGAHPTCRPHFFALAARIMRHILVDEARKRGRAKRGGGVAPMRLDETFELRDAASTPEDVFELAEALGCLEESDARASRVFDLSHFGGFTQKEIGEHLRISPAAVFRDLVKAKALLAHELGRASR